MKNPRNDDRIKPVPHDKDEKPEIYAVLKQEDGVKLSRRAFLGSLGVGVLAFASGCATTDHSSTTEAESFHAAEKSPATTLRQRLSIIESEGCGNLWAHTGPIQSVTFSSDGTLLISNCSKTIKLWSMSDQEHLSTFEMYTTSIAVSPNGKFFASGNTKGTVSLCSLSDGKILKNLKKHSKRVHVVTFSHDGALLASASDDNTVMVWSIPNGRLLLILELLYTPAQSVIISSDGTLLATGRKDNTIDLWSLPSGKYLKNLYGGRRADVKTLCTSSDGKLLLSGGNDKTIKLWSLPSGIHLKTFMGHSDSVNSLSISPDGSLLVSGSDDGTVRFWSLPDGKPLKILKGYSKGVAAVNISPDGGLLALGCEDNTIKVCSMPDGSPCKCLFDYKATPKGTKVSSCQLMGHRAQARSYQLMGKTYTVPCGTPLPAGAVCICDCIATQETFRPQVVCICDTIMVPAGMSLPAGATCVCNTIAVGAYNLPGSTGRGSGKDRRGTRSRICTCDKVCTCDTVPTGRYY